MKKLSRRAIKVVLVTLITVAGILMLVSCAPQVISTEKPQQTDNEDAFVIATTVVAGITQTAAVEGFSDHDETPAPVGVSDQQPVKRPTVIQSTASLPTQDPDCDSDFHIRETVPVGEQKTYMRCPQGEVEYIIQPDDMLVSIVLDCPGEEQQIIGYKKDETLSAGELLAIYKSDRFMSKPGCRVYITVVNTIADQMGYTLRQEVVGTYRTPTAAPNNDTFTVEDAENVALRDDCGYSVNATKRWIPVKSPGESIDLTGMEEGFIVGGAVEASIDGHLLGNSGVTFIIELTDPQERSTMYLRDGELFIVAPENAEGWLRLIERAYACRGKVREPVRYP